MKDLVKRKINDHLQNVSKRRKLYKSEFGESLSEFERLCLKIPLVSRSIFNSIDDETFIKVPFTIYVNRIFHIFNHLPTHSLQSITFG